MFVNLGQRWRLCVFITIIAGLLGCAPKLVEDECGPQRACPGAQRCNAGICIAQVDAALDAAALDAAKLDATRLDAAIESPDAAPDSPDACIAEICDGVDNDCDGETDEDLCSEDGDEARRYVSRCDGRSQCENSCAEGWFIQLDNSRRCMRGCDRPIDPQPIVTPQGFTGQIATLALSSGELVVATAGANGISLKVDGHPLPIDGIYAEGQWDSPVLTAVAGHVVLSVHQNRNHVMVIKFDADDTTLHVIGEVGLGDQGPAALTVRGHTVRLHFTQTVGLSTFINSVPIDLDTMSVDRDASLEQEHDALPGPLAVWAHQNKYLYLAGRAGDNGDKLHWIVDERFMSSDLPAPVKIALVADRGNHAGFAMIDDQGTLHWGSLRFTGNDAEFEQVHFAEVSARGIHLHKGAEGYILFSSHVENGSGASHCEARYLGPDLAPQATDLRFLGRDCAEPHFSAVAEDFEGRFVYRDGAGFHTVPQLGCR